MGNKAPTKLSADCPEDEQQIAGAELLQAFYIPFSELKFVRNIAASSKSTVDLVEWRGDKLASKTIPRLHELSHTICVARLRGVAADVKPFRLLTDYYEMGDVQHFIAKKENELSVIQIAKIARNVALAMHHIHQEGFVYRDLALRNIFLCHERGSSDYCAVVGDLGWMVEKDPTSSFAEETTATAPWRITAPEALAVSGPSRWSEASDVWSFGVMLYSLVTRQRPYHTIGSNEELRKAVHGGLKLSIDVASDVSPSTKVGSVEQLQSVVSLFDQCVQMDPGSRSDFLHIIAKLDTMIQQT